MRARHISHRQRPQVLVVTNMWPHESNSTYGIFVKRQVESLSSLGVNCEVLFLDGYRSRLAYARTALHMFRLNWSRCRPRLVHGHGGETALAVRWFFRAPVIVSFCGDDLLGTPRPDGVLTRASRIRRRILRRCAGLMTATITKSREMEATLPAHAQRRNLVLPNGVDRSLFRPRDRDAARQRLGWPLGERVVLFAADPAVDRKRYWLAEAACREAQATLGPIRLEVATGVAPDLVPHLMAAADSLLLTSAIEGSPNVVKEAVTCGLPVVSTDVGDVREVLAGIDPSAVCLAEPGALGAGLVRCLAPPQRSNGWERAAWLDEKNIASRLVKLYDELAPDLVPASEDIVRGIGETSTV